MLKYFYKTLLVSFLCGSLLLLDFSYKGNVSFISSAQAETVKTEGIKDGDLMSTLTMSAIGLLTQRLYMCKMSTDMMLAAAGGTAYVAGEILAFLKLKKAMKDIETEITRDKNGNIDQKQIETLEKLKESYQKAKETATTKKTLQMAAAAAFAAAAVVAYLLEAQEQIAFKTCTSAATAAGASCTQLAGTAASQETLVETLQATRIIPKPSAPAKAASEVSQGTLTTGAAAAAAEGTALASASAAACASSEGTDVFHCKEAGTCGPAGASIQTACTPIQVALKTTEGACPAALSLVQTNSSTPKFFMAKNGLRFNQIFLSLLGKMFINDAKADLFSPLGIATSAGISFMLATSKTLGLTIDSYLLAPMNRAIIWGVLAGLTFSASSATDNQIKTIESNIQKIDMLINGMRSYQNGVAQSQSPSVQNQKIDKTIVQNKALNINGGTEQEIDLKANGINLPCVDGENSDKCPSFSNQLKSQANFNSLSDNMQTQIGNISKMTDGLNGTSKISSTTLGSANALAAQANAIAAEMAKKQKELQDKLKASGKKIDLAKDQAALEKNLRDAVQKELDKNKTSAGQMLASFGGGFSGSGSGSNAVATDASKNGKDSKNSKKGSGIAIPVVGLPAATMPRIDDKAMADSLKADADKAAAEAALTADAKGTSIDDYELKNDITKDKDSSIFELISNRYQKSGYPRLFKRIK